jgi:hypothetical protein
MDRNEIRHDPRHLGVPSGASKMVSEPMIRSAQTVHLSYTNTISISKWTEMRFHMTHVTWQFHHVHPKRFSSLWYFRRKPCTFLASDYHYFQIDGNELPLQPRHLGVASGASKTISKPMVHLVQTMQLSCN